MKAAVISVVAILALHSACGAPAAGPVDITPYVAGGNDASAKQFPYQVSIQVNIWDVFYHQCGGAILSNNWIVTAAHCITLTIPFARVVAGAANLSDPDLDVDAQINSIDLFNIHIHPEYDSNTQLNDIALLKMTKPFVFGDTVQAIPISKVPCTSHDLAAFSGFGITTVEGNTAEPSPILQGANMTVLTYDECYNLLYKLYGENTVFSDALQICSVGVDNANPCILDDGSPLVQDGRLIGVLAWLPEACSSQEIPTVFTRTGSFVDFIEVVVDDLAPETLANGRAAVSMDCP